MKRTPDSLFASDSSSPAPRRRFFAFLGGAAALLLAPLSGHAEDWDPNFTFNAVWHDNATNAEATADQIDSLQFNADVLSSDSYPVGTQGALYLTAHFALDWWPRYAELFSGAAGGRAGWRHTFGTGALAPEFSAEIGGDAIGARDKAREGSAAALTFTLRKRFNDRWRVTLAHEIERRYARSPVFDQEAFESSAELSFDLNALTRLVVSGHYRDGDTVTYSGNPRGEVEAIAAAQQENVTFGRPMIAYSVDARTWGARAAIVRALDTASAIVAAYEWRATERTPVQFENQMLSVGFVYQF